MKFVHDISLTSAAHRAGAMSSAPPPAAPVAEGELADQIWPVGQPVTPLDISGDFTGLGIVFSLAPASAALPSGLSLSPAGVLSGTPTSATAAEDIIIRASNGGGYTESGFFVTVIDVPAQMAPPAATALGDMAIRVDRAADPADNFSPLLGFDLRLSSDGSNWTTLAMTSDPQDISGLSPGTSYQVQNRATNAAGHGAWSASSTVMTDAAVGAAAAEGGTESVIDVSGTYYRVHKFLTSGTLTVNTEITDCEYLIVGGGGGGARAGGGGGAGGYLTNVGSTAITLTVGAKTITVGAGGNGSSSTGTDGNAGGDSVAFGYTADGGGFGGTKDGGSGGSGGGGGRGGSGNNNPAGGTATAGQGYDGGIGERYDGEGGGGGGSSAVGQDADGADGGSAGGAGTSNSITGSALTYAAGGDGYITYNGTGDATDGTGTGGGGNNNPGADGGDGVVIVRYEITEAEYLAG